MTDIVNKLCLNTHCSNFVKEHSEFCPRCIKEGHIPRAKFTREGVPKTITLSGPLYLFAVYTDNVFQNYMTLANRDKVSKSNKFIRYEYMGRIDSIVED